MQHINSLSWENFPKTRTILDGPNGQPIGLASTHEEFWLQSEFVLECFATILTKYFLDGRKILKTDLIYCKSESVNIQL